MIIDPGNHWHKDDMSDEEPRPGITEPNYDEHPDADEANNNNEAWRNGTLDNDCFDCPGKSSVNCCENRNIGDLNPQENDDEIPF